MVSLQYGIKVSRRAVNVLMDWAGQIDLQDELEALYLETIDTSGRELVAPTPEVYQRGAILQEKAGKLIFCFAIVFLVSRFWEHALFF
jgi:hypothetical protein